MTIKPPYRLLAALLTLVFLAPATGQAQKSKSLDFIYIAANGKDDFIRLRWAPSSPFLWQMGNRFGYTIVKYVVAKNGYLAPGAPKPEAPAIAPIKPAAPGLMKASLIKCKVRKRAVSF
jgi:uncharacterized protein